MELFFQAYLFAWVTWTTLSIGCAGILILHHAVRGKWSLVLLRVFEAGARLLPLMGLLSLPILANVLSDGSLYPWLGALKNDHLVTAKAAYLNKNGFVIRTVIYFLILSGLTNKLTKSGLRQDKSGDLNEQQMRANWGGFGLVVFFLTITLAYVDWVMSLEPRWSSTIFPAWFAMGGGLMAHTFAIIYTTRRIDKEPYKSAVSAEVLKDWGNIFLMFTLVWAYFSLSQFLIIWSANIPEEVGYYTIRFKDPLLLNVGALLILCQWFLPFLALLAPRTKKRPELLRKVAYLSLTMKFIDTFWTVAPFFAKGHSIEPMTILVNAGAFVAMGVIWLGVFHSSISKYTPLPLHDPRLEEALHHARS